MSSQIEQQRKHFKVHFKNPPILNLFPYGVAFLVNFFLPLFFLTSLSELKEKTKKIN